MRRLVLLAAIAIGLTVVAGLRLADRPRRHVPVPGGPPAAVARQRAARHPLATWAWPSAVRRRPCPGVTRWLVGPTPDGTTADLVVFDFGARPNLRLELYDQDEDDAIPFDDSAPAAPERGIGWALPHLAATRHGTVVAAWNGLFFALDHRPGPSPTARTSLGWSRDSRRLYLLVVKERDGEAASALAVRRGLPDADGWTVADLQRFWLALGVSGAVDLDGGDLSQMACVRADGCYDVLPPRSAARKVMPPFPSITGPGALMFFYVLDSPARER